MIPLWKVTVLIRVGDGPRGLTDRLTTTPASSEELPARPAADGRERASQTPVGELERRRHGQFAVHLSNGATRRSRSPNVVAKAASARAPQRIVKVRIRETRARYASLTSAFAGIDV